jgi:hypothetical protein
VQIHLKRKETERKTELDMKIQTFQRYGRVAIWPYLQINFYRNELSDVPKMNIILWHTSTGLFTQ